MSVIANANESLLGDDAALKKAAETIREGYLHKLIFEKDKNALGVFIDIAGIKSDELVGLEEREKRRHLRAILEGLSLSLTSGRRVHGLGYHNLLFMAAELLLLEQEATRELPMLLIEEPEAHLHPQLQMRLVQFIKSKAKSESNTNGVQCILTTHSPNISSKADPSEIILLKSGYAWPLRPGETELLEDDYIYLRKFLDVTKANVFFASGILFVEGEAENILLPELAALLGRPLDSYGVSIVKYDNSGSWKRFAKLFLRKNKDTDPKAWVPTKVCILRDLDLWPVCAERKAGNTHGFVDRKPPSISGQGGNLAYWEDDNDAKRTIQVKERIAQHKVDESVGGSLERQSIKVIVSNRWTFEFCLARFGLYDECCEALALERLVDGSEDEKATYIQGNVNKTDMAYRLAEILRRQCNSVRNDAINRLEPEKRKDKAACDIAERTALNAFALSLKSKLPPYVVEAIEYVTAPISG